MAYRKPSLRPSYSNLSLLLIGIFITSLLWKLLFFPSESFEMELNFLWLHQKGQWTSEPGRAILPGMLIGNYFACDRSEFHADVCNMHGDVFMDGNQSLIVLITSDMKKKKKNININNNSRIRSISSIISDDNINNNNNGTSSDSNSGSSSNNDSDSDNDSDNISGSSDSDSGSDIGINRSGSSSSSSDSDSDHGSGNDSSSSSSSSSDIGKSSRGGELREEKIRPYSRKWEEPVMQLVREISLRTSESGSSTRKGEEWDCHVRHEVPLVVFSTGGYTGNVFHEFNDGIIPLFITTQHLKGEVVLAITDFHNWWVSKYSELLTLLSSYPLLNFDNQTLTHCFPEATIGLFYHSELSINPSLMPKAESMAHFRDFLDHAYTTKYPISYFNHFDKTKESRKPRLVIIVREKSRVIENQDEIIQLAENMGYEILILKPVKTTMLRDAFRALNESDVLLGVHGAALTHFLFLKPGATFIQVIPLGLEWASETYYGVPATKMGFNYIPYKVDLDESTLIRKYPNNDTVLRHSKEVYEKGGWSLLKEIYLEGQNVSLSIPRMTKVLSRAKRVALRAINL